MPDDVAVHLPVSGALATLLRWLNLTVGGKMWKFLDASMISTAIGHGLRVEPDTRPVSFATALAALGNLADDDLPGLMQAVASAPGESRESNHTGRWPWRLDLIITSPRSRIMMKLALAHRVPVAVGMSVTERWTDLASVATGVVRTPEIDANPIDGDCVVLDGWDDEVGAFSCRFMAGPTWGCGGVGWIPYEYACSPLWVHELVMIPNM